MRLWEEVGTQLKGVTEAMKDLTHEMRDVRERLIRIEAQDQPVKIAKLETELREAQDEIARVEREAADALVAAGNTHSFNLQTAATAAAADKLALEKVQAADKLALEKRLTRMEMIVAPLTMGGSALVAAGIGLAITFFTGHPA